MCECDRRSVSHLIQYTSHVNFFKEARHGCFSIQQWRITIGCFVHLKARKFSNTFSSKHGLDSFSVSLSLRLFLFLLLVAEGIEINPGPRTKGGNNDDRSSRATRVKGGGRGLELSNVPNVENSETIESLDIGSRNQRENIEQPTNNQCLTASSQTSSRPALARNSKKTQKPTTMKKSEREYETEFESDSEMNFQTSDEGNIPGTAGTATSNIPLEILLDIQKSVKRVEKRFDKMEKNMKDLKKENEELKKQNDQLVDSVSSLQRKVEDLNKSNGDLLNRLDNLQGQSRSKNLKFYNMSESVEETWEQTEKKVRDYIENDLGIDSGSLLIERAHRLLGKFKPRAVIVKFSFYKEKERVLQKYREVMRSVRSNASNSTNSIHVGEDFTERVRKQRAVLMPFMRQAIDSGKRAYLRHDKLCIDGQTFIYDDTHKNLVPFPERG